MPIAVDRLITCYKSYYGGAKDMLLLYAPELLVQRTGGVTYWPAGPGHCSETDTVALGKDYS